MKQRTKRKIKGSVKSKTMGVNAAIFGAAATDVLLNSGGVIAAIGGPTAVLGLTLANLALRWISGEPLEDKAL